MATDELVELKATISNAVLSQTEKRLIHSRMADTKREIEVLDEEIFHLQSARASKLARVTKLKAMISPIRELPGEIITEIFSQSTSTGRTVTIEMPTDDHDLSVEPWNISQVCSRWRGVALAMPQLWNDARIIYDMPRDRDVIIATQKLAMLFSRSGKSLLSLDVRAHALYRQHDASLYKTMIGLLAPYYHRLQRISFEPAEYMPKVFQFNNMNSLESIKMEIQSLTRSPESGTYFKFQFDSASKLREISISMDFPDAPPLNSLVLLPWEKLTKLHLIDGTILSPGSGHELLRQCHSLISCAFTIGPGDDEFTNRDEIVMAHLEVLEVAARPDSSDNGQFFGPLVAPSLKGLSLISEDGTTDWSDEDLVSFISRSSCDVENFSITFAAEDVDTLLHTMPSVVRFSQSHYCSTEMLEEIGSGRLFPRLCTFICGGSSGLNEMLMMLECRAHKSVPSKLQHDYRGKELLRTVKSVTYTVMEDCWVDEKSLRWLERIMDEGLAFVFVDKRIKVPGP